MDDPPPRQIKDYLPLLRRYALTLARNPHDAEDLVQEGLARAYAQRGKIGKVENVRGWLMAILHHTFISDWRRRQHPARQAVCLDEVADIATPPAQEHAVRLRQLQQAFLRLSADQREALHLVAIEGLSYQAAADVLDIPIGTLMSRLGRARAALRAMEAPVRSRGQAAESKHLKLVGGDDG